MKVITLSRDWIIDGCERVKGEVVRVSDSFPEELIARLISVSEPEEIAAEIPPTQVNHE